MSEADQRQFYTIQVRAYSDSSSKISTMCPESEGGGGQEQDGDGLWQGDDGGRARASQGRICVGEEEIFINDLFSSSEISLALKISSWISIVVKW